MKFQRGQAIVEFALVLPLFLFFVIGIIFIGVAVSDYLMLSNVTRTIAHEASLTHDENTRRNIVIRQTEKMHLSSGLYVWNPDRTSGANNRFLTVKDDQNDVVVVTHADHAQDSFWGKLMHDLAPDTDIDIVYTMYCPKGDN